MKLLLILSFIFSSIVFSAEESNNPKTRDSLMCHFGIYLPKFPSRFVRWTRTKRKGCLVEDKDQIIQQFLSEDEKQKDNAHQIAACKCLSKKGKIQKWLYHNKGKKSKWVDKVVWKKVGDHYRGRMYENFTDMLRWDNMLKQGEINKNYLKFADKCYFKKITNTVNDLLNPAKAPAACKGKKRQINKRIKLMFGKNKIEDFVNEFKGDLEDVVKNKISDEHKGKNYCISYKNYLAMKSPSRVRYEIMEKFRTDKCKEDMEGCYKEFQQMFSVKTSHAGPYYTQDFLDETLGKVDNNKSSFVETIQQQLKGSRRSAIKVNSQLRDDPFIQALLDESTGKERRGGKGKVKGLELFKSMVQAKDADLFFTDPKNIMKVFKHRNKQCGEMAKPEFLSKLLCDDGLPPINMEMIQEDLAPEMTRAGINNPYGNKTTEYLTAKYMCTTKKKKTRDENGKKVKVPKWSPIPQDKDYQAQIDKILKPRKRMISDLEMMSLKKKDPSLNIESDYEKFNKQVCNLPKVVKKCGKQGQCNYLREIANSGTIQELIAQYVDDPEKQKAIYDLIKSYRRPYRTTDPKSGDLMSSLMMYLHRGIDHKKTNPKEVYYIAKNILDMNQLIYGSKRAQQARAIHSLKETKVVTSRLDEIKADPERYKALKESLGIPENEEVDINNLSKEEFITFAKNEFGGLGKLIKQGQSEVPVDSAASRAFAMNNGEVIGGEQGESGSSYFSDYNLGADQSSEDAISNYNVTDSQLSSTWAPSEGDCFGKTCHNDDGDIVSNGVDSGLPYNRTVNVDPDTYIPPTNNSDGGNNSGDETNTGVGNNDGTGINGPIYTPRPDVQTGPVVSRRVVTTSPGSFTDPNATVVNVNGRRRVMAPVDSVGEDIVDTGSQTQVTDRDDSSGDTDFSVVKDENTARIEQNIRDYETMDTIADIRRQLDQEQYKTRRTLDEIAANRNLEKFYNPDGSIRQGNIRPSNNTDFSTDDSPVVANNSYAPTYGVSTNSSKKADFDNVMATGNLPGTSSGGRGPAAAAGPNRASGAAGLAGAAGGISGSALGGIAKKLNMKDPSVLKAIKRAKIQLEAENIFPYQLVQEMGISEVVSTFGLEGQTFYALEIKDFNFTLHKIDLSEQVIEEGGLAGKRKELLASLTLLRGSVGAEATFKQIQNSYVVESSKQLTTNEDKKKLFLKTMTYEELDQLLITAVQKELKLKMN